jgi:tRNA uridine 5-carboxymethylaminomethyl modification enzyme
LEKIVLRPNVNLKDLSRHVLKVKEALIPYSEDGIEQAEIQTKYQVYIDKEKELVDKMRTLEDLEIPERFDYQRIVSLGAEAREKLTRVKPKTLGQASRISGINPADVQILMVYMGR